VSNNNTALSLLSQRLYYLCSWICIYIYEYQLQGFAELESEMLRYMGSIDDSTMIVTTGEFSTDLAYMFDLLMNYEFMIVL
jgi:hypothetical protein